jgi:rhodanese-related sulfurtransferase
MARFETIEPAEIRRRLDGGEGLSLIDIRERCEWEICRIEGARLMPLSEILYWQHRLDPNGGPYVIYCHHGVRSRYACDYLSRLGQRTLIDMGGGIDRWSRTVDPGVPLY